MSSNERLRMMEMLGRLKKDVPCENAAVAKDQYYMQAGAYRLAYYMDWITWDEYSDLMNELCELVPQH